MNASPEPVVHVGYPRTGTTWLRNVVFPRMRGVTVRISDGLWQELAWKLSTAPDDAYRARTLETLVQEIREQAPPGPVIFGQSDLVGYYGDPETSIERSRDRLHHVFPEAKILVFIRRQPDILLALYGLYVRVGGHRPLRDVLAGQPVEGWKWYPPFLEYDRMLAAYVELYGADRVRALPYELIRTDPDLLLRELLSFCGGSGYDDYEALAGQRVNRSFSPPAAYLLRTWNGLFVQSRFNSEPRFGARSNGWRMHQLLNERIDPLLRNVGGTWPSRQDRELLDRIGRSYADSNARTAELCGFDLSALGYDMVT